MRIRYLTSKVLGDGTTAYYYNPPPHLVAGNVVSRLSLGTDFAKAAAEAERCNQIIDAYREGAKRDLQDVDGSAKSVSYGIDQFYQSRFFTKLAPETQRQYRLYLERIKTYKLGTRPIGDVPMAAIIPLHTDNMYITMSEKHGKESARQAMIIYGRVWNCCIRWGLCKHNPFAKMNLKKSKGRDAKWDYDTVQRTIAALLAEGHVSVATLVLLTFELGQNIIDIAQLKWAAFDGERFTLRRQKTGVLVSNKLEPGVLKWVVELHTENPSAEYVIQREDTGQPWTSSQLGNFFRKFKARHPELGLAGLQLRDLRRTAVMEANDGGVTVREGASMTGHHTMAAYEHYARRAENQADAAMEKRWEHRRKVLGKTSLI